MKTKLSDQTLGAFLAVAGIFLFSAKAVLVKVAYMHFSIDAVSLLLLRMIFSLPFYLFIMFKQLRKKEVRVSQFDVVQIILLGIVGYYLASYFDFEGLKYISASLERLILFIYPTLVLFISSIFLKNRITKNQWAAIAITYLGIMVTYGPTLGAEGQENIWKGSILIFFSALTYAIYIAGSGNIIPRLGSVLFTSLAMTVSCLFVMMHHLLVHGFVWEGYPSWIYVIGFSMALFSTVIPSFLISEAIKKIGASNFAVIGSLGPISTIILAVLFIHEKIDAFQLAGTVVVILGVLQLKGIKSLKNRLIGRFQKVGK